MLNGRSRGFRRLVRCALLTSVVPFAAQAQDRPVEIDRRAACRSGICRSARRRFRQHRAGRPGARRRAARRFFDSRTAGRHQSAGYADDRARPERHHRRGADVHQPGRRLARPVHRNAGQSAHGHPRRALHEHPPGQRLWHRSRQHADGVRFQGQQPARCPGLVVRQCRHRRRRVPLHPGQCVLQRQSGVVPDRSR